ncbi:TPA: hypothetical protein HA238_03210 [Candidatus Micrarchaeota archaeon]|nr:hypothetical protein [Candidatus Micrarchaeota archaeon]
MPLIPTPQQKGATASAQQSAKTGQPGTSSSRTPLVDGFKISAKLKTSIKDVSTALRSISFLEVAQEKDGASAAYVESRDINRIPYLFSILRLTDDSIELEYTIPSGISPKKRRLDMVRYFMNLVTLLSTHYTIDTKVILQIMENVVKDATDSVGTEYSKLYTEYDTMKKELDDVKRKLKRLEDDNNALRRENYDVKGRNDELMLRLGKLENLTDDVLRAKVQEWIVEHNGEINIVEFSKVNNVNEVRVEEVLNQLVTEGYIESVQ